MKNDTIVFVYGTLMSGMGNNYLLRDSVMLGVAQTSQPYVMTSGYVPYVHDDNEKYNDLTPVKIIGEAYRVDEATLEQLDMLEGHPNWYERKKVQVYVRGIRNPEPYTIEAWLYFNNHERAEEVGDGNYRRLWQQKSEEYYHNRQRL